MVAEMVASKMLAGAHKQTLKRVMGAPEITPYVIQISGRCPHETGEAARVAADLGADMIDINMGCPARKVTKGLAGSALMKEPDLALSIIDSVVGAVNLPVSLKMRLGWDEHLLNAADIAIRAEQAGVQMLTVHGRTRNQFYKGQADWLAISDVVKAVRVPVIANGDIIDFSALETCLAQSTASGVMIGRGAQGRPWIVGEFGARLATGASPAAPTLAVKQAIIAEHYEDMLSFYGVELGLRNARKHLGWYIDDLFKRRSDALTWRARLCREEQPVNVIKALNEMFASIEGDRELAA